MSDRAASTGESVRAAVARGELDARFVELVLTIARKVAIGIPTPSGSHRWEDHDFEELAFGIVEAATPDRLVAAAKKAKDHKAFRRYLTRVARNVIAGRARKSPSGWVMATVDEKLAKSDAFERHANGWRLTGTGSTANTAALRDLVEVARTVETTSSPWDPRAERGAPLGHSTEIRAIAQAALEQAGWLTLSDLGQVFAQRYNVSFSNRYADPVAPVGDNEGEGDQPDFDALPGDIRRELFEPAAPHIDELDIDIEIRQEAEWFVSQMRDDEVLFVGLIHQGWTAEAVGKALGLGRTTAYTLKDRVSERLGEIKADGDTPGMDAKMLAAKICAGRLTEFRHLIYRDDSR